MELLMLKKLFFTAAVLVPGLASAGSPSADLSVNVVPKGTSSQDTMLPMPPAGYHWVQTFGDEFNESSGSCGVNCQNINLSTGAGGVWEIERYCGSGYFNAYTPPQFGCSYSGVAAENIASGGILSMTYDPNNPPSGGGVANNKGTGNIMDSAKLTGAAGPGFAQRYGFFVYDAQLPQSEGVQEIDLEWFGQGTYQEQIGYPGSAGHELYFYMAPDSNHPTQLNAGMFDSTGQQWFGTVGGPDLSAGYHQYGYYWQNDGSAHGSLVAYFDGKAQTGPYTIQGSGFDKGAYFDIFGGGQSASDPLLINWIRAYQLVPN
jgi:hypothetical protein